MTPFIRYVLCVMLATLIALPVMAAPNGIKQHYVLRQADYIAITGCSADSYVRSLQSALHFLVFADTKKRQSNNNITYARRHTLPLFRSLLGKHKTPEGYVAEPCIPPSLRMIGFALRLLDAKGRYGRHAIPRHDFIYNPAFINNIQVDPRAFPTMSRLNYITRTGCKVSPSSYDKYRTGYEWVVFKMYYADESRDSMIDFLEDLVTSQPAAGGFVSQQCLIPAVSRIAAEFGLLDHKGRYRSQR